MPDHSHDKISSNTSNVLASEGQIWDSLNPDQRAQLLGQSIAGEANDSINSINTNSVYQQGEGKAYETVPYTSLPPQVQFEVSNRLHEAGYFQDSYGGRVYEVEDSDRFECKDCEETFTAEEDFRVHRKINHDDNGESETESQEAYFRSLEIDPDMTKNNLKEARKIIRGESSRVEYPQNDPATKSDPKLPKGRKEYDDNPNHYFYDTKLFRRGSRGGNYDQTGTALTEARALINLEEKILKKYGWESTKEIEKSTASREVFSTAVAKEVNVGKLHPRTIKILDSVNKPFLVNTLSKLAQEADVDYRGDVHDEGTKQDDAPFSNQGEPVIHQDYDPEHPHEHNAFDLNFGDKVAEEDDTSNFDAKIENDQVIQDLPSDKRSFDVQADYEPSEEPIGGNIENDQKTIGLPTNKRSFDVENGEEEPDKTCATCGFYSADEQELHSHVQDHESPTTNAVEDFPFEDEEEQTTVTAEPDLLQNVNTDVLQVEAETDYDPNEKFDDKAEEARILQQYTGYKPKAGEAVGDILDGAIDNPVEQQSVDDTIYDRKLDGQHEDKIARELGIYHEVEYEDAIERIRSIEVNDNDRTAKTLFGKKFADCNEAEVSEMRILGGEARRSKGVKND